MQKEMTKEQALAELARICKVLGVDAPTTDAGVKAVFDEVAAADWTLARILDVPSVAASEFAEAARQHHRGARLGRTVDVAIRDHNDRDCRPSLRERRKVADAVRKSAQELAGDYAASMKVFHRQ